MEGQLNICQISQEQVSKNKTNSFLDNSRTAGLL